MPGMPIIKVPIFEQEGFWSYLGYSSKLPFTAIKKEAAITAASPQSNPITTISNLNGIPNPVYDLHKGILYNRKPNKL
jgi:hypothetical protein